MYKKKKFPVHYVVLIAIAARIIVLSLLSKFIDDKRTLTGAEKVIKDVGLFVNKIVYKPIDYVNSLIKEHNEKKDLHKKYKALEERIDKIELTESLNNELKNEVEQLKSLLNIEHVLSDFKYINASVVNRNINYWFNNIIIDKGEKNGVFIDMPVIVNKGLIGKVIATTNFNSTVKLLTTEDINNKISVKIKVGEEYVYGVLNGYNTKKRVFIIEGIDQNVQIPFGAEVVTSGLGNHFPSGVLVGKVKAIETDNFDLSKIVEVESNVNFDDLKFVTVLSKGAEQ